MRQAVERRKQALEVENRSRIDRQRNKDNLRLARDRDTDLKPPRSASPCFDELGRRRRGCQFGGLNLIFADPELDPSPMKCFICWSTNYQHARCPRKQESRGLRFCFSCGRRHRTLANCERCKDAHARHQMSLGRPDPRLPLRQVSASDCSQQGREHNPEVMNPRRSDGEPRVSPGV